MDLHSDGPPAEPTAYVHQDWPKMFYHPDGRHQVCETEGDVPEGFVTLDELQAQHAVGDSNPADDSDQGEEAPDRVALREAIFDADLVGELSALSADASLEQAAEVVIGVLLRKRNEARDTIASLTSERDGLKSSNSSLSSQVSTLTSERDGLKSERDSLKAEVEGQKAEIVRLTAEVAKVDGDGDGKVGGGKAKPKPADAGGAA